MNKSERARIYKRAIIFGRIITIAIFLIMIAVSTIAVSINQIIGLLLGLILVGLAALLFGARSGINENKVRLWWTQFDREGNDEGK